MPIGTVKSRMRLAFKKLRSGTGREDDAYLSSIPGDVDFIRLRNASECDSAVVASHLSMCRVCAQDVRRLEQLGGVMLGRVERPAAETSIAERAFERWSTRGPPNETENDPKAGSEDQLLPLLLTRKLPTSGEILWKNVSLACGNIGLPYRGVRPDAAAADCAGGDLPPARASS